jgi:DnaJ like chaperone protein
MGRVVKSDGRVSRDEIRLAEAVMAEMELDAEMRKAAIRLFDKGKSGEFPLDDVLADFRRECHGRTTLLRMFVEIQVQAAYADGMLNREEDELLWHICARLGFSELEYRRIRRMVEAERHFAGSTGDGRTGRPRQPSVQDAYAVLGVSASANDAEVKKAYRRLLSQHHPDKLVSKGLPEEMMKVAAQKTHEIKLAYEHVKKSRGL